MASPAAAGEVLIVASYDGTVRAFTTEWTHAGQAAGGHLGAWYWAAVPSESPPSAVGPPSLLR